MKKKILAAVIIALSSFCASAQQSQLKTLGDSISYLVGQDEGSYTLSASQSLENSPALVNIYKEAVEHVFGLDGDISNQINAYKRALELRTMFYQMKEAGVDVDIKLFLDAYQKSINGPVIPIDSLKETSKEVTALMQKAYIISKENKEKMAKAATEKNKADGASFIGQLKKKDKKVKTTESGLSYKQIKGGKGVAPKATDKVKVHYTGKLIDGTVFDSSVERGEPAVFSANQLIKGFTEGLLMMKPGAKYTFYIPSDLGYGDNGSSGHIPGGATLIFDVELLEVNPQ